MSFVLALAATALAVIWLRRGYRELGWLGLLILPLLAPALPSAQSGREVAAVVQPNVPTDAEWTMESVRALQRRLEVESLAAAHPAPAMILWPEVPAPLYYDRDAPFRTQVQHLAQQTHSWVLFGTVTQTPAGAPLNSAELLSPEGQAAGRYDKVNLVPFGEFIPPLFGWVSRITQEAGDFTPGEGVRTFQTGGHRIGTFICYESVFPYFVREFTAQGAEVLLNLSNDGYFGKSAARRQHLSLVRMRALENGRWILRSTNDGLTVAIDPAGRITQSLQPYVNTAGRLAFNYETARTLYSRAGDWFVALCACVSLAGLVPLVYRRK